MNPEALPKVVESQGVPADVMTMNSRIEIREGDEAQTRTLVLSYPRPQRRSRDLRVRS